MIHFDIDGSQIEALRAELGLTEKQAKFALGRALRRTSATLKRQSERGLKSKLDVKKLAYLRRRLRLSRLKNGNFEGARLWFGANDMPVSALRGRLRKTATGASFSGKAGNHEFVGGFIRKSRRGWGRTILVRKGKARHPLREASAPVKDEMDIFIEDEVFAEWDAIFWNHFRRDMEGRAMGFGNKDYRR